MRGQLLNTELFDTLFEAQVLTEMRKTEYNCIRLHNALGHRPPAPQVFLLNRSNGKIVSGLAGTWTNDWARAGADIPETAGRDLL